MSEAFYGVALCLFKTGKYKEALVSLDHVITSHKQPIKNFKYYKYLKATCYKELGDYKKAEKYYIELCTTHKESNNKINYLLYNKSYVSNDGWKTDKQEYTINILANNEFFKRFNNSDLEHIVKLMNIHTHPSNTLLFLNISTVAVILQGKVSIYSHILDLEKPEVIAEYGPGSVIGNAVTDNGISRHAEYWVYANETLELCVFGVEEFNVSIVITLVCMVPTKEFISFRND